MMTERPLSTTSRMRCGSFMDDRKLGDTVPIGSSTLYLTPIVDLDTFRANIN